MNKAKLLKLIQNEASKELAIIHLQLGKMSRRVPANGKYAHLTLSEIHKLRTFYDKIVIGKVSHFNSLPGECMCILSDNMQDRIDDYKEKVEN